MNTILRIGLGIMVVVTLVLIGLAAGWALWGRQLWAGWEYGMGPGMMREWDVPTTPCTASSTNWRCGGNPEGYGGESLSSDVLTIEEAHEAVERYVDALGYPDLEIAEVMEFERNFYAIVKEADAGIGAMELLVEKWTGAVSPEMGPNMMWNARYGMHGRSGMVGGTIGANTIAPQEALKVAQRWLDAHRPGVTVEEHADPFYGYYTIHTLEDDQIEGMLSVHGATGQVWYHTWHGAFIQMIEEEEGH